MNILEPELVWIEGRCYRFYESNAWSQNKELGAYEEFEEPDYNTEEDEDDDNIKVFSIPGGKYLHSFHIPRAFYPFIIGSKGMTRKRLESETKTIISVPRVGQGGDITITGRDRKSIITAKRRINLLVESSRTKLQKTHFISIPMTDAGVIEKFEEFKKDILNNIGKNVRGISEQLFQKSEKLHLTVGMMTLLDEEERKQAVEMFYKCKEDVIKPVIEKNGPIKIKIQGIECMNDDPAEVKVLYSVIIDGSGILQEIVDKIVDYFTEAGLMKKEYNKVKLHMTIMNTKFLIEDDVDYKGQSYSTFDATKILRDHKFTQFGEVSITTMHISQLYAYAKNGYYEATEKINLFD